MQKILSLKSVILAGVILSALYCAITMRHIGGDVGVSKQTAAQGTGDMDSLARLDTYAKSGTSWGMSPFGSGAPLTEEPASKFKKPSTEWKTRTINGITYGFGDGNPREVATKREDYASDFDFLHDSVVTADTEKNLLTFLSNPTLTNVFNKCSSIIRSDALYDVDAFDLERVLFIDGATGRKKLDERRLANMGTEFSGLQTLNITGNAVVAEQCLNQSEIKDLNVLVSQYNAVFESYTNGNIMNP
jgi:hypothetical protein